MGTALNVLGLMSGTSLDGLDLCAVQIEEVEGRIHYHLLASETMSYPPYWQQQLEAAARLPATDLLALHAHYGKWLGREARHFIRDKALSIQLIASHGHTVHHQPNMGFSFQLGDGHHLAAESGIDTVADFRQGDVALGGQGAPLMPLPDRLLFPAFKQFLNLGGIANLSIQLDEAVIGYDICAFNQVFNRYAQALGKPYDAEGKMAEAGTADVDVLNQLNALPYFHQTGPKSLGREEVEAWYFPLLNELHPLNALATMSAHAAIQLSKVLGSAEPVLVTGGGAYNLHVLNNLRNVQVVVPERNIIDFKEALGFALLGWLRYHHRMGALSTVTGAEKDHLAGVLFPA